MVKPSARHVQGRIRIIAGEWRRRLLQAPSGDATRPPGDRTRETLFAMLTSRLGSFEGLQVADLFAGTGALGLEAISRGAARADFVETRPSSLHALRANVALLRLRDRTRIFKRDALPFAAALEKDAYDVAFADPPYESRMLDRLLDAWHARPFSRLLAVEHAASHELPPADRRLVFDDTVIGIYGR